MYFSSQKLQQSHACGLLRIVDKVDNDKKCVVTNAQHPKIKRGCASNIIHKSLENIFFLVFVPILKKIHSLVAINTKIILAHIDGILNTSAMDFQWITEDGSLLQCTTLNPPKNHVVFALHQNMAS